MAVKIRLQRKGRKKFPFYHIVIADSRAPRDGKFIENIGIYNPMTKPATIELDRDKAYDWMNKGAQPTETVRAILRFKGVLYKKHLMDGISKGAHTEEQALAKWNEWVEAKETKIRKRIEQTAAERESLRKTISGAVPTKIVIKEDTPVQETPVVEETVVEETVEKETIEQPEVVAEVTKTVEEIASGPDTKETHEAQSDEVATSVEEKVTDEIAPSTNVEVKTEAPAEEVSQTEEVTSEVTADVEEITEVKEEEVKEEEAPTEEISAEGEKPADEEKPADVA